MNPLSVTRRRAEAFDSALRAGEAGEAAARDARTAELLTLVSALRASSAPEARPAFVGDLRAQLVLAAETELRPVPRAVDRATDPPAPTVRPNGRPARERRLAAAVVGLALVGASTTMAVAAQSALPGDTLYSLKRVIEDADTTLRVDQGRRLLGHASNRLVELQALAAPDRDTTSPPVLESTLETFVEQADEASVVLLADYAETGEVQAVDRLHVFAAESLDILGRLQPVLPASVRPELRDAAVSLVRIDAAADRACPECAAGGVAEVPSNLLSATALDPAPAATPAPTPTPEAAVPAPAESTPAPPTKIPERTPTRPPGQSPATQQPVTPATPKPPATAPTNPPASPRPPRDTSPQVPPVPAPPVPTPTRGGLVDGLLDDLTGGRAPAPTAPSPTPLLPGLGGLLDDTAGGLGSTADQLLPQLRGRALGEVRAPQPKTERRLTSSR